MAVNLDVGFAVDEKGLLSIIDNAAAHWQKAFSNVGMGIDNGIAKVAKAAVDTAVDTGKKIKATEEEVHNAAVAAANRAASLKAKAEQDYIALKSKYVLQGLDVTRQAIHEEEQKVKASRDAITRATQEGLDKEATAVLKAERDKQNARLQGLRSVEKEITGARTFSEQLEKNVYGPVNEQAKKGGALSLLLFGEIGTLQKKLKETESQVKSHEEQIAAHAKEAQSKIEAQEHEHATKLKALEDQIAAAKGAEAKKELEEVKRSIEQQIAEERKLTQSKAAEEQLQLQHHKAELEKELSETKAEHAKAASEKGGEGKGGIGIGQMAGIGIAVEGVKKLMEVSSEAAAAQTRLQQATGLTGEALEKSGEEAEELGHQYKIGGDAGKEAMAAVGSFTHATGDQLKQQAEDAIILAQKMGSSTEAAAKLLGKAGDPEVAGNLKKLGINLDANATAEERAAAVHQAAMAAKAGVDAGNDNANKNSQEIMMELEETTGKYASTILNLLNPALKLILPILPELLIAIGLITIAMNAQSIAAKASAIWDGIMTVAKTAHTVATGIGTIAALAWAVAVNAGLWPVLAVVAAVGLLVLGIIELVKHFKEVVAWVAGAADSVLSFLGITGKAEAATRKHTTALDANKLALAEQAKNLEESRAAAERNVTALENLQKANDDLSSAAKKNTDLAVTQIEFLQKRLADPTVVGEKRKLLQKSLDDTIAYSKKNVAVYEGEEAAHHAAAIAGGAAADNDEKKKKDNSAKIDKDAYTAAKNAEDIRFSQDKLDLDKQLAAKTLTTEAYNKKLESVEDTHVTNLKDIASKHRKGHEMDAIAAESAFLKIQIAADKKKEEQAMKDAKALTENAISALELRGAKEGLTEKQIAQQKFVIEQDGLLAQIALLKDGTEEKAKLQATYNVNAAKHTAEGAKEAMQISHDLQKDELDSMKEGIDKKLALIDFERKRELENKDLTEQQIAAIQKKYRKQETDAFLADQKEKQDAAKGYLQQGLDMSVGTWAERGAKFKQFALQELKNLAINEAAKIAVSLMGQTKQTALVEAGFLERQATYIAEAIASAASAAGTWIATAAKAVYNAFETMPFPVDIIAAAGSIAGVVALATQVPKLFGMADGGFVGGAGGDRDDMNPRMLSRNEFVVNSRSASKWAPVLHAINSDRSSSGGNNNGGGTFMLDESQVKRLEKNTVLSSNRMLLDHRKTLQQQARARV